MSGPGRRHQSSAISPLPEIDGVEIGIAPRNEVKAIRPPSALQAGERAIDLSRVICRRFSPSKSIR